MRKKEIKEQLQDIGIRVRAGLKDRIEIKEQLQEIGKYGLG